MECGDLLSVTSHRLRCLIMLVNLECTGSGSLWEMGGPQNSWEGGTSGGEGGAIPGRGGAQIPGGGEASGGCGVGAEVL